MMATDKKTTLKSGNTKTDLRCKKRDWTLTLNEKTLENYNDIENYLLNLKSLTYYLCVEHIGSENKHYHILCQFDYPIKLSLKKLHGAHIEYLRGTPQEAYTYLMCEDEKHKTKGITCKVIEEQGSIRRHGRTLNVKEVLKADYEELKDLDFRFYNAAKKIKEEANDEETFMQMLEEIKNNTLKGPEIIYIYGDPGSGKTYGAYKEALKKYETKDIGKIYINNNFFKFINENAKCFIIEEFRDSQLAASEFLQLTDKYGYTAATKGGFKTIRPECIIICCYKNPNEIYINQNENNKQFKRRVSKFYICDNKELKEIDINNEVLEID